MSQFVIMTTSYRGPRKFLMGSKEKTLQVQKGQTWTRILNLAAKFEDQEHAKKVAKRFRFGDPTAITVEQAELELQEDIRLYGEE